MLLLGHLMITYWLQEVRMLLLVQILVSGFNIKQEDTLPLLLVLGKQTIVLEKLTVPL